MLTSRFQLGLIAALAAGLGFSLSSSEAVGYPAGAAVSLGTNPVWSVGGTTDSSGVAVVTAPLDSEMVVTDVVMTFGNRECGGTITFTDGTGVEKAKFYVRNVHHRGGDDASDWVDSMSHSFRSGIRVSAGETLTMSGACALYYTLSGYYAQP
jgi:hypothetical protein